MEVRTPKNWEREEGFTMLKGGKSYTIADIEALPEGERAELIDGELFMMSSPKRLHQDILLELAIEIRMFIRKKKGTCKTYIAPFAVRIKKDNRNYVEPDISVICDKDKLDEKGCQGAPDWMIEIVSPSSKTMDYERKVKLYREAGAREYWIVDPEAETVTVYDFAHADGQDIDAHGGRHGSECDTDARNDGHSSECDADAHDNEHGSAHDADTHTAACDLSPVRYAFSERIKVGIFEDLWLCLADLDFS